MTFIVQRMRLFIDNSFMTKDVTVRNHDYDKEQTKVRVIQLECVIHFPNFAKAV